MPECIDHILVVYDDSAASRRALGDAVAIADEHGARISVVSLVAHDTRRVGCCISPAYWNGVLNDLARSDLDAARRILGERPETGFEIVPGEGAGGIRRAVAQLGCDLVLVPSRGPLHGRLARRVRRRVGAEVVDVRAA